MRYLAIGFWVDCDGTQTFSLSRETDSIDPNVVSKMLADVADAGVSALDTILIIESAMVSTHAPEVVSHWTASEGDWDLDECEEEPESIPNGGLDQ